MIRFSYQILAPNYRGPFGHDYPIAGKNDKYLRIDRS